MPITIDFEKDYLYNQGIEKGEVEKTYQTTVNMLRMGFEISAICQALEVKEDYVLKIKKELGL